MNVFFALLKSAQDSKRILVVTASASNSTVSLVKNNSLQLDKRSRSDTS